MRKKCAKKLSDPSWKTTNKSDKSVVFILAIKQLFCADLYYIIFLAALSSDSRNF